MASFIPEAQWPAAPQMKYRVPGLVSGTVVLWSRCDRSGLLAEHALWSASLTSSTECDELYWNAAKTGKPRSQDFVHEKIPADERTCY